MANDRVIPITVGIKTKLGDMSATVSKLQSSLEKGTAKIDLNKGIGSSLSKLIFNFEKNYSKIIGLIGDEGIELGNSKEFIKNGRQIISTFEEIQRIVGNFDTLSVGDAKKLFPDAFDKRISDLREAFEDLGTNIDKFNNKTIDKQKTEQAINDLEKDIVNLRAEAAKESQLKIDGEEAQKKLNAANDIVQNIRDTLAQELTLRINTKNAERQKAQEDIDKIIEKREKRQSSEDIVKTKGRPITYKGASLKQWTEGSGAAKGASSQQREAARKVILNYQKEEAEIQRLEGIIKKAEKEAKKFGETLGKIDKADLAKVASDLNQDPTQITNITDALREQTEVAKEARQAAAKLEKAQKASEKADKGDEELEKKRQALKLLEAEIEAIDKKINFDSLAEQLNKLDVFKGKNITGDILRTADGLQSVKEKLEKIDEEDLDKLKQGLHSIDLEGDQVQQILEAIGIQLDNVKQGADDLNRIDRDIENLKNQVLDFFSISGVIQIFKNAVQDAFDTVKELDAAMTETAVVTDFSIGDMWEKLPEYSAQANKLGTSIKGLYEATTLYYQQGLESNEAMEVGTETMKMARIANMEAADATTAMTAALRGFNMEINQTSAQRVNDVYSELAAITAADTSQIATAMGKTASIAASANMEFETTAALLAQIIETTQEAPETAGTALTKNSA